MVRGRPREFDAGEVLDAALELFWTRGFRATSTRDLEHSLGMGQSSLYNAFGSKAGLLDAALDRYEARLTAELLAPLESAEQGLGAIDSFFDGLLRWLRKGRRGCMLVNMMVEDGGRSSEITKRTRGYRRRVRVAFEHALSRAVERRELESPVPGRAHVLLSVVIGLNIAARGGASSSELDAMVAGTRDQVARWAAPNRIRSPL